MAQKFRLVPQVNDLLRQLADVACSCREVLGSIELVP